MSSILTVRNLSHRFGKREALSHIEFDVEEGEIFGFLGPNGGGKTTLFRILSTHLFPSDAATISVGGIDLLKHPHEVRKHLGVVFQTPGLDDMLTVSENLIHQGHLYGLKGGGLKRRIEAVLEKLSLEKRKNERVGTLSGGLKRRVEIAKALLHEPKLMLLDEPTTGLDPGIRKEFWGDLKNLKEQGVTLLVTTHLIEEGDRCDRVMILHEGKIVALDTPVTLKKMIGGDVITIQTKTVDHLRQGIETAFALHPIFVDESLHIEIPEGSEWVVKFLRAFPNEIDSISVSKPTLEDVFIRKTGHRLGEG